MKIRLKVAKCAKPTGRILRKLLEEQGLEIVEEGASAVVCYGTSYGGTLPVINNSSFPDKYEELCWLHRAKVKTPNFGITLRDDCFPVLARKLKHRGGTDIKVLRNAYQARKAEWDYFTELVPSETEFRTWIFRDHHLGTYEKVKVRPAKRKGFGRNYDQGYGFQLVHQED